VSSTGVSQGPRDQIQANNQVYLELKRLCFVESVQKTAVTARMGFQSLCYFSLEDYNTSR
jgi:hypothetical protein